MQATLVPRRTGILLQVIQHQVIQHQVIQQRMACLCLVATRLHMVRAVVDACAVPVSPSWWRRRRDDITMMMTVMMTVMMISSDRC